MKPGGGLARGPGTAAAGVGGQAGQAGGHEDDGGREGDIWGIINVTSVIIIIKTSYGIVLVNYKNVISEVIYIKSKRIDGAHSGEILVQVQGGDGRTLCV